MVPDIGQSSDVWLLKAQNIKRLLPRFDISEEEEEPHVDEDRPREEDVERSVLDPQHCAVHEPSHPITEIDPKQ